MIGSDATPQAQMNSLKRQFPDASVHQADLPNAPSVFYSQDLTYSTHAFERRVTKLSRTVAGTKLKGRILQYLPTSHVEFSLPYKGQTTGYSGRLIFQPSTTTQFSGARGRWASTHGQKPAGDWPSISSVVGTDVFLQGVRLPDVEIKVGDQASTPAPRVRLNIENSNDSISPVLSRRTTKNPLPDLDAIVQSEINKDVSREFVPLDLFGRVQTQLKANGQSGGTGVRNKHNALLKGLIWCRSCGRPMTHSFSCKGNKRYRYYVCGTAMQKGWSECPAPSVPAGEIERFVIEQIESIGTNEDLLNQTIGQIESRSTQQRNNLEAERKALQRQLRSDHEKLRAIAANASNNGRVVGLPELQTRIDAADDRLKAIAGELESLESQAIDTADVRRLLIGFEELWQNVPPREQVRLTSLLIDRVEFDGVEGNVGITFHDTGIQSLDTGEMEVTA